MYPVFVHLLMILRHLRIRSKHLAVSQPGSKRFPVFNVPHSERRAWIAREKQRENVHANLTWEPRVDSLDSRLLAAMIPPEPSLSGSPWAYSVCFAMSELGSSEVNQSCHIGRLFGKSSALESTQGSFM